MKEYKHNKKQTSFRLSSRALEIIDKIKEVEELEARTVTLEFLLRDYLSKRGLELDKTDQT